MRAVLILSSLLLMLGQPLVAQKNCFPFSIGNGFSQTLDGKTVFLSRPTDKTDSDRKAIYGIFSSTLDENAQWSKPEEVSFANYSYTEYHPVLNVQNDRLFFISRRPEPGTNEPINYGNLWYVEKQSDGWSKPEFLIEINHKGEDTYPTFTEDGTLYFNSDRDGGKGSMDIYVSQLVNNNYQDPQPLKSLNSSDSENDLVVHPKGEWIIFNRYYLETGELDLLISFNRSDEWSSPQKLDLINRNGVFELTPSLSPDLKYFYYEINGFMKCVELETLLNSVKK